MSVVYSSNSEIVLKAMSELFVNRDTTAIERYWGSPYLQHNPGIPDGHDFLATVVNNLPKDFSYEPGFITESGDIVMIHGRYTGWGPMPLVAVDIFRVVDGKLCEHWDVMQEEVQPSMTKSGRSMFG